MTRGKGQGTIEHWKWRIGNPRGIALILVLWIIAILSVIVLEFCFAMRTEVNVARTFKEETQLYATAGGGMQRAIAELIYKHDPKIQQIRKPKTIEVEEIPPEMKPWVTDGRPYSFPVAQGKCEIRVMGEGGKVNINLVSEVTLKKILEKLGLEKEVRDVVADSILDWRDSDDFYRINGAENEYYQSLKEPYTCKNGNLDSIEELLLVRGVTPSLFYGKGEAKQEGESKEERVGLKDIFSIYASGEQIDINSAAVSALRMVLGIPGEVAQQIVNARVEKNFDNQQDLLLRVPELSTFMGEIGKLIVYQSMVPYYTVESRGMNQEGSSVRGVKAIVKVDSKEKRGYKIILWVDSLM